jgi:hypothetical protein
MTKIAFNCNAKQAVDFNRDEHHVIGHILSFKIDDKTLDANIQVREPVTMKLCFVVGLLTSLEWGGGPEDEMSVAALVSSTNRRTLLDLVHKSIPTADAKIKFVVYDYDPTASPPVWFKTFHTNDADISGAINTGTPPEPKPTVDPILVCPHCKKRIDRETGEPAPDPTEPDGKTPVVTQQLKTAPSTNRVQLMITVTPEAKIQSPMLWEFSATIKPGSTENHLHFSTGSGSPIVKTWGVPV